MRVSLSKRASGPKKKCRQLGGSWRTLHFCRIGPWPIPPCSPSRLVALSRCPDARSIVPANAALILKRPGRFDRVVQFRNPNAALRREYYRRLSPILTGEQFEIAIMQTEGFSFAQLRETYILGSQSAFEQGRDITVADIVEAIDLHAAGAQDLKTSISATGFVSNA